ncbi:hypothetical protein SAMN04488128_1021787 [Chitinophaga eiseniae]|uniref:N-acetyltransferase domain-containing protein n=1 Tax=Chitinophaga eiseniae TaxID=634771 RepID=A0A1T4S4Q3_9BACT|nr:hypothetical protein [Chitinophaga eiseniae]SKA23192.1 hypothetical protein SAMN04488128_1021787 [Chitinophaga eiseniae]
MLKVRVFKAIEYPEECLQYIAGHRKVLEAYGVTKVTSANVDWMYEPYTYIITVSNDDYTKTYGGCRIQLAGGSVPLPIESAINSMDPRIYDIVKELAATGGTGEFCGLWNSREVAGWGIGSIVLFRVVNAVLNQLPVTTFLGFCAQTTFRNSIRTGYQIMTNIGNQGTFYYPKEDLIATALILNDPLELKSAHPEDRERMMSLRNNPVQTIVEKGPKGEMQVDYDLRIMSAATSDLPLSR